jgi:hypothetical protein
MQRFYQWQHQRKIWWRKVTWLHSLWWTEVNCVSAQMPSGVLLPPYMQCRFLLQMSLRMKETSSVSCWNSIESKCTVIVSCFSLAIYQFTVNPC